MLNERAYYRWRCKKDCSLVTEGRGYRIRDLSPGEMISPGGTDSGSFLLNQKFQDFHKWYRNFLIKFPGNRKIDKFPKNESVNRKFRKIKWDRNSSRDIFGSLGIAFEIVFSFPKMFHSPPLENSGNADLTCGDQFQIAETRVLIMEDMLVFLQEKDQKYSLLSLDQKVREFFLCVNYSTLWLQSEGLSKLHVCSSFLGSDTQA